MLLEKVKKILTAHRYKVGYSSLYAKETFEQGKTVERNLINNQYFTIYDQNNRVICRLHDLKEGEELNPNIHIPHILEFFQVLELVNREQVVEKLKALQQE